MATEIDGYEVRVTAYTVGRIGGPIFSEFATRVEIQDDADGEYVVVSQCNGHASESEQKIAIDVAEWPAVRWAIESMVENCRQARRGAGTQDERRTNEAT